ncbi:MAG: Trm112 family protein [Anaerolineae bacterium]|nr:Trm112 family protein [Anaerolineae bacterium]
MLSEELLAILACPACKSKVKLVADRWLVCQNPECRRKYPIKDGIPQMLIEEGDKYVDVSEEELAKLEP